MRQDYVSSFGEFKIVEFVLYLILSGTKDCGIVNKIECLVETKADEIAKGIFTRMLWDIYRQEAREQIGSLFTKWPARLGKRIDKQ